MFANLNLQKYNIVRANFEGSTIFICNLTNLKVDSD